MHSRPRSYQSIAIYSDPAPAQVCIPALEVTKVLLFTVIPLFGFPKHRYLQRSCPLGSQSNAIYSDPALAQVVIGALKVTKAPVSLFTVIPHVGFPKYRYLL